MKIDFKNSLEMEFFFFETDICYAWLGLHKDAMIIMFTKIYQLYYMLYKNLECLQSAVCKWTKRDCTYGTAHHAIPKSNWSRRCMLRISTVWIATKADVVCFGLQQFGLQLK